MALPSPPGSPHPSRGICSGSLGSSPLLTPLLYCSAGMEGRRTGRHHQLCSCFVIASWFPSPRSDNLSYKMVTPLEKMLTSFKEKTHDLWVSIADICWGSPHPRGGSPFLWALVEMQLPPVSSSPCPVTPDANECESRQRKLMHPHRPEEQQRGAAHPISRRQ